MALGHQQKLDQLLAGTAQDMIAACNQVEATYPSWVATTGEATITCAVIVDDVTGNRIAELNPSSQEARALQTFTVSLARKPGGGWDTKVDPDPAGTKS